MYCTDRTWLEAEWPWASDFNKYLGSRSRVSDTLLFFSMQTYPPLVHSHQYAFQCVPIVIKSKLLIGSSMAYHANSNTQVSPSPPHLCPGLEPNAVSLCSPASQGQTLRCLNASPLNTQLSPVLGEWTSSHPLFSSRIISRNLPLFLHSECSIPFPALTQHPVCLYVAHATLRWNTLLRCLCPLQKCDFFEGGNRILLISESMVPSTEPGQSSLAHLMMSKLPWGVLVSETTARVQ